MKQLIFSIILIISAGFFIYTALQIISFIKLTKPAYPIKNISHRINMMLKIAFGQSKIFRFPFVGFLHAIVFWGFCIILVGSVEMIVDGITGNEKSLAFLGSFYDIIMAFADIFAFLIFISIIIFLFRRVVMHVKRFHGIEMKNISHLDANIALTMILLLMASLLSMNMAYCKLSYADLKGIYPISMMFSTIFFNNISMNQLYSIYEISWWGHIVLIFIFANILPYSKHFHVFMSIPNVFLSHLEPLGKLTIMEHVVNEVKLMMNPNAAFTSQPTDTQTIPQRFGVKDIEDVTWKNYLDSLSCTECGRCTSVCPANITGKKLSPRKLFIDLRARMKEKGPGLLKNKLFSDEKSLIRDYISTEELWACTTCNACAQECPVNINHPSLIIDMRRFLVMEEAAAPSELNTIFTNIENNGAPWKFSPDDRLRWTE